MKTFKGVSNDFLNKYCFYIPAAKIVVGSIVLVLVVELCKF